MLYSLELISRLSINFQKNTIAPISSLLDSELHLCASWLNYSFTSLPITFFGLPLRDSKLTKANWMSLLLKVHGRPTAWNGKFLFLIWWAAGPNKLCIIFYSPLLYVTLQTILIAKRFIASIGPFFGKEVTMLMDYRAKLVGLSFVSAKMRVA